MSDSLQSLIDRSAILSAEVQQRFGALIAGGDFDVDFSAEPRLRFTGEEPLDVRPHLIGSSVDRRTDRTWHWGWDNVNDFPAPVVELSQGVRTYGAEYGIEELTQPELPVTTDDAPAALTLAAKAITGAWGHYPVPAGGGTTAWVLVDDARLNPGEPQLKPVVRALAAAITGGEVSDHRAALTAYAQLRGLRTAPLPDGGVRLLCADGSADVTFDEADRVASCQAHQPLEGEAAQQYEAAGPLTGTATYGQVPVTPVAEPAAPQAAAHRASEAVPADEAGEDEAPAPSSTQVEPAEAGPVTAEVGTPEAAAGTKAAEPAEALAAEAGAAPDAGADQPAKAPAPHSQDAEPKQEKKGFLKRLFGR